MTKKTWKFRPSVYAIFVLVVLLLGIFRIFAGQGNPLFEKGVSTTLYLNCYVGEIPDFYNMEFFQEERQIDENKLSFDESECDFNTVGTYQVPVLYDGRTTSYQIQVQVKDREIERESVPSNGEVWAD